MTDTDDQDSSSSWGDDHPRQRGVDTAPPQVDALLDPETDQVTFVSTRSAENTTTAWITVDVETAVAVSERR